MDFIKSWNKDVSNGADSLPSISCMMDVVADDAVLQASIIDGEF